MKLTLPILCCIMLGVCSRSVYALWDFAITTKTKILFYDDQWREITSSAHQFNQLSAVTFDETEEIIYFNDRMHKNGSIFSLKLPVAPDDPHIIENIVQRTQQELVGGIAYDPLNRNLFWTDAQNKKIYFQLIDSQSPIKRNPSVLLDMANEDSLPDGLAIDICRRKLYWTNSNFKNATIERIELDGKDREVIVNTGLYLPHGIIIDQLSHRLYWVVDQQGSHFTVESSNLDGTDRQVIVKGLNNVPFSLAVTKDTIFWTDLTHNAIWSHTKFIKINSNETLDYDLNKSPKKIISFNDQPRGMVARTRFQRVLQNDPQCAVVVKKITNRLLMPKPTTNTEDARVMKLKQERCLNGGKYIDTTEMCTCPIGYDGARCEISECHNFCVHGTCTMDISGFPKCTCQQGFYGERCQSYKCNDYCLNGGICKIVDGIDEPSCECTDDFAGIRCEQNSTNICALFCMVLNHEPETYVPFGCHDICEELATQSEDGTITYAIPKYQHLEVCHNSNTWNMTIVVVVCGVVISLSLILLIVHGLRRFYKPARPRIKKTFVVKKQAGGDTPLTNRSTMATEQCEITIENCCNMNICDTPCFDPKLLQKNMARESNKDDKKILIHSMEDELY